MNELRCLTPEEIQQALEGNLPEERQEHVEQCDYCKTAVLAEKLYA